jgi:hypothetical protein
LQSADCFRRGFAVLLANLKSETFNLNSHHFVTFAVCDPCFLKTRVGENSPSL